MLARLGIAGDEPLLLFPAAGQELITSDGRLSRSTYERLLAAAQRQPLAADPLMFAGMRALGANDLAGAERALVEARERNPRLRLARMALVGLYLRLNRVPEATAEIAALVRILPEAGNALVPELARLAMSKDTRPALAAALGADPLMAQVLDHLVRNNADPALVLELGARQPLDANGNFAAWQAGVIRRLVDAGDLARAQSVWRSFAGLREPGGSLIYDPEFRGLPGGEPFNWMLSSSNVGSAERAPGGGLDVDFFGRVSGPLASQLLVLQPGRYRLSLRAEGSADAQGSRLLWRLSCRGGPALLELPLQDITYTPRALVGSFSVAAAGCPAQTIELRGLAGEFPARQAVKITDLKLESEGGR